MNQPVRRAAHEPACRSEASAEACEQMPSPSLPVLIRSCVLSVIAWLFPKETSDLEKMNWDNIDSIKKTKTKKSIKTVRLGRVNYWFTMTLEQREITLWSHRCVKVLPGCYESYNFMGLPPTTHWNRLFAPPSSHPAPPHLHEEKQISLILLRFYLIWTPPLPSLPIRWKLNFSRRFFD